MKKIVLVIEDDNLLQKGVAEKLIHEGFEVELAKDGKEGFAKALEIKPDCILLDVMMPKMGGMQMLQELREYSDWGKAVPVIIFTNTEIDDEKNKVIAQTNPVYCLVKSEWKIADIVQKIKEVTEGATEHQDA